MRLIIFFQKMRTLLLMILAIPVVLVVRALRPLVVIRFGFLISKRIGHFAINTDIYLCERDAGMHPPRTFDIFYHYLPISNYQLKKMWERTGKLHIFPFSSFMQAIDRFNRLLPGGEKHMILTSTRDIYGLSAHATKPHLSFIPEEERLGRQALQKMGITDGASFVCFHVRDSAYLDTVLSDYSWRYHNYRDSNIHNCVPAAEELARRGYFMVRMGAEVKEALRTRNPKIIDYAVKGRTDFLDIYLCAKCLFFLGDTAGINDIPKAFLRPIIYANFIPLGIDRLIYCTPKNLFIPKKLWLGDEHRFLSFREILDSEIERFSYSEQYERLGIEVIENTPREIIDVACEMDERLKGTWQTTEEDEELQRRFWSLFKAKQLHMETLPRLGAKFLRQNQELLN